MALVRYAVLNDIHMPYESKAYARALKIIEGWSDLKGIILNGDIAEIESVSTHAKHPEGNHFLSREIDYVNEKFDFIEKKFQGVPVALVEGNHCHRVFRYIRDIAPQLWGIVEAPSLFKFDERGWKFFRYGPNQLVRIGQTELWVRHEPLGMGQYPCKVTAENSYVDILFGHTHIQQTYVHKKFGPNPKITRAYSGGWLGDATHPIFDYRGSKDKWVLGFSEIIVDEVTWEYGYRFVDLTRFNPFYEKLDNAKAFDQKENANRGESSP